MRYRPNPETEYTIVESPRDWVELCNAARKHLFPDVTEAEIAAQNLRADEVMKAAKKKRRL